MQLDAYIIYEFDGCPINPNCIKFVDGKDMMFLGLTCFPHIFPSVVKAASLPIHFLNNLADISR